jgi:hypothetical protein
MNHVRWVAWGVIDVEAMDRIHRRNYLKRLRKELPAGIRLESGGVKGAPWYKMERDQPSGAQTKTHAAAGMDALKKVCTWLLLEIGDHERSEDGGVRRAGDEAEGSCSAGDVAG